MRLLRDVQVTVQFHAGYAVGAGDKEIDGYLPLQQRQRGTPHCRAYSYAEVGPAAPALVGHGLSVWHELCACVFTFGALPPIGAAQTLKPVNDRLLIKERFSDFGWAKVPIQGLAMCFFH